MLFFVAAAFVIIVYIDIIHYTNHFESRVNKRYVNQRSKCEFKISPIGAETYRFFPLAFLLYNIFIIFSCIIIICISCVNYYIISDNNEYISISQLFFGLDLQKHQQTIYIAFTYILSYTIMFLSIWDSLFAFYRYYSTYITAKNLLVVSTAQILKLYIIYVIPFCALYATQIHLFYWLFPVMIVMNICFNVYCNFKFVQIITDEYSSFPTNSNSNIIATAQCDPNLIQNITFLWKTSLIYSTLQSISLGLYIALIKYNMNVIYFLPLLWCCISSVYSTNFVRNKTFLLKQKRKCCCDNSEENPPQTSISKLKFGNINSNSVPKLKFENISSNSVKSNNMGKVKRLNTVTTECKELLQNDSDKKYDNDTDILIESEVYVNNTKCVQISDTISLVAATGEHQRMTFDSKADALNTKKSK